MKTYLLSILLVIPLIGCEEQAPPTRAELELRKKIETTVVKHGSPVNPTVIRVVELAKRIKIPENAADSLFNFYKANKSTLTDDDVIYLHDYVKSLNKGGPDRIMECYIASQNANIPLEESK